MTAPMKSSQEASKEALRTAGKEYAKKQITKNFEVSELCDNTSHFPQFQKNELNLGKVLGKGGFGTVFEVTSFDSSQKKSHSTRNLKDLGDAEVGVGEMESRKFIADHCVRKGGDSRYAAKFLSPEVVADPPTFIQGIMDMATETRVLSDIEHPNIIKMRACGGPSPFEQDYFIVMDRLYDTLEGRIQKWANRVKRNSGFGGRILDRGGTKKNNIMEEKLVAAFDLSAAIGYLHGRRILYRDLKPENVGFDIVRCLHLPWF